MPVSDMALARRYVNTARHARDRGIPFTMSLGTMRRLLNKEVCYYTGEPFHGVQDTAHALTIDRVDSTLGYADDNCVACKKWVNTLKSDADLSTFLSIVKGVERFNKAKSKSKVNAKVQEPVVHPQGEL